MPEFEESDPQLDPANSYTPSTGESKNKGGRRRSGGFKSEAAPSNSKIGEVDPTEALKINLQEKPATSCDISQEPISCSLEKNESSETACCSVNAEKTSCSTAQPSQATLDSIQKVEERITHRRAEVEKNRASRGKRGTKKIEGCTGGKHSSKGGLIAAVGRFFRSLFGVTPKNTSTKGRNHPRRKNNSQRRSSGQNQSRREDASGKRHRNHNGKSQNRRRHTSKSS